MRPLHRQGRLPFPIQMRRYSTLTLFLLWAMSMGSSAAGQDAPATESSPPGIPALATPAPVSSADRPDTWVEAVHKVREELLDDWRRGDYSAFLANVLALLSGNRVARELLDNQRFWKWTVASFVLMLLGQAILLGVMGHRIRLMALMFPRRPLGPVILGVGGILLGIPLIVGLFFSVVGLPLALALWTFLYMAAITGKMGILLSIGWAISRGFGGGGHTVYPFFVAYLIYSLVVILNPFAIGRAFFIMANVLGIGLALRTRFGFGVRPPT